MTLRKLFGPGTLVTAAFIGPGTLTTCTKAGITSGYDLLWALMFAGIATIVLQEMAARLGWATQQGLGEAIRREFDSSAFKVPAFALVISAILVGNAAYEGGNLGGAVVGAKLLGGWHPHLATFLGLACFLLLWFGKYRVLERLLIGLVIGMSACFLITAVIVKPDPLDIVRGLKPQAMTQDNLLTILGLIGTTVVPYNLFLHAAAISQKWKREDSLTDLRIETCLLYTSPSPRDRQKSRMPSSA